MLAIFASGMHEVAARSATPTELVGRSGKTSGGGCDSGCHTSVSSAVVTITGPTSLLPGQSAVFTVTTTASSLGSGVKMGMVVAASDPGSTLSESAANLVVESGEIIHSAAGGALNVTDAGGSASYQFTYTMPANAIGGSAHTLYAAARLGLSGASGFANNFTITTPPSPAHHYQRAPCARQHWCFV